VDCAASLIAMPLIDDPFGIWSNWVRDKKRDVILNRQQFSEIRLGRPQ